MAPSPSPSPAGISHQRPLTPTATSFIPKVMEANKDVLKSCFITQTVPNTHRFAGIVGICTVPEDKADMNNLGWHIADFLAFRALLCGQNPPKAQTWLSMCNIPALVEANPQLYTHGKDRRLVASAVRPDNHQESAGLVKREDDIQVETCAEDLKEKFKSAVKEKLGIAEKYNYPLLLIVCGLTSLEQDIYFGELTTDRQYTMKDLRCELGDSIENVEATIITPSLFSAGWQVNASFGRLDSTVVRGKRVEFLARQFGGIFAPDLVRSFLGWKCPAIDEAKVEAMAKRERFPGPACPSEEVQALISQLEIKIQSYLVGGLSSFPIDHSFSFNKSKDEWETLIGRRERSLDYQGLEHYEQKWRKLPLAESLNLNNEGFSFMGNAFGGTKESQLNHIKYLIEESYLAWPDHWALNFGQETRGDLERFMNAEQPSDIDCHEIFNVLEHRARTSILGDTIVQYFDLPIPHNQRCREWNHVKWKQGISEKDRSLLIRDFNSVFGCVPGPNLPPGINKNNLSRLQMRLENGANYVRAALGIRFLTTKGSSKVAIDRITSFLEEVKAKQAEILVSNSEIYMMCSSWLNAINIPILEKHDAVSAARIFQGITEPGDTSSILDFDVEYDIYRNDDVNLEKEAASSAVTFIYDEKSVSSALVQQEESPATERPRYDVARGGNEIAAAASTIPATEAQKGEDVIFQQVVDLAEEEARLITEIRTTNERARREKLTLELLEVLQRSNSLALSVKAPKDVAQNGAAKPTGNKTTTTSFTKTKDDDCHNDGIMQADARKSTRFDSAPQGTPHELGEYSIPETEPSTGRKTPPHLRGIDGRAY
ncbi:hypothetical protein F4825DRAFT_472422 [Nemania diffusa]|nr:hypothetical protein F4825DRAFT_472422 [Nemania diffusa]